MLVKHLDQFSVGTPPKSGSVFGRRQQLQGIAEEVHPFSPEQTACTTAESVAVGLEKRAQAIESLAESAGITDKHLAQARYWVQTLVNWYNFEHRHSAIGFVTPEKRHTGQDIDLLKRRTALYEQARQRNPQRWSGKVRNWSRIEAVHLNPDKPNQKEADQAKNTT